MSKPVAILSTETFDALSVDPTTIRFGATETEAAPRHVARDDVNGDGRPDLILRFRLGEMGIKCGDTEAILTGETVEGQAITGRDVIQTVQCQSVNLPEVPIDIRPGVPGSRLSPANPTWHVPVAILSADLFDATTVDPATVRFGATGTEAAPRHVARGDVNGDGRRDLVVRFRLGETGIACGDTEALLTGETFDGQVTEGSDTITTVECP